MVVIAGLFMAQGMDDEVRAMHSLAMQRSQPSAFRTAGGGGQRSSVPAVNRGMSKDTAMLLTFLYAGLAWAMSNGIVLNPRRMRRQAEQ
jgi:hypothetical protein